MSVPSGRVKLRAKGDAMLRRRTAVRLALLILMGSALSGTGAHADTFFLADLTNAQENPPATPTTTSTGLH